MSKINYSIALILDDCINKILYDEEGNERTLPFKLKYKINKNKSLISKDVSDFEKIKLQLIAIYGEPTADGKEVIVKDPNKADAFMKAINLLLLQEIEHSITKIEEEDLSSLTMNINIPYPKLEIFQAYMCDEPELLKELTIGARFNIDLPVVPEDTPADNAVQEKASTSNEVIEEKVPLKKTTKKSSSTSRKNPNTGRKKKKENIKDESN